MGLQTVPGYIGLSGYQHPVELDRNMLEAVFGRNGVVRFGDFDIAPTGTAQQISIAAGRAHLLGYESLSQGGYFVWSDNTQNVVFGPPSGSARIDTLILRVVDTQYGSDPGSPRAEWQIVAGVPSGTPTARPDSDFNFGGAYYKPGAWVRMADVRINVGDTVIPNGQIARFFRYTRNSRGNMLTLSYDTISDMLPGDIRWDLDTNREKTWNGTYYRPSSDIIAVNGNVNSQNTASVSYTDLGTVGPSVTIETGAWAEVTIAATAGSSTTQHCFTSFAVSGASTISGDDSRAMSWAVSVANSMRMSITVPVQVNPGSNTFTMKYRVGGGTGTWFNRTIHVRSAD